MVLAQTLVSRKSKRPVQGNAFFTERVHMRLLCSILFLAATALHAETSMFRAPEPVGTFVPKMISGLGDAGFRFKVRSVYNEAKDGKQGFVFLLEPRGSLCDLQLFNENNGKSTLLRLKVQDTQDAARFQKFLTSSLRMTEVGVSQIPDAPPGWPKP